MMEDQAADARFRIHHHPVGQLHADLLGLQQLEDPALIVEVRARRIPEAVALAAIARREEVLKLQ
jgi:hypothetical protein